MVNPAKQFSRGFVLRSFSCFEWTLENRTMIEHRSSSTITQQQSFTTTGHLAATLTHPYLFTIALPRCLTMLLTFNIYQPYHWHSLTTLNFFFPKASVMAAGPISSSCRGRWLKGHPRTWEMPLDLWGWWERNGNGTAVLRLRNVGTIVEG